MKKYALGFSVIILAIIFVTLIVKKNEVDAAPEVVVITPEKLISKSNADDNQSQALENSQPLPPPDNMPESNTYIPGEDHLSLPEAREAIRNDPYFKGPISDKLFEFLDAEQLVQNLQSFDSRIPRNDGRAEILDENGLVKVTDYRSPQEDIDLGFDQVNRLREQVRKEEISIDELRDLDRQGDPAASFELARRAFKVGLVAEAEAYIIRAAQLSNSPAPFTLAGLLYGMPTSDPANRIARASWFLAAYARGDYTVVTRLRSSFGNMSIEFQNMALEMATQILAD